MPTQHEEWMAAISCLYETEKEIGLSIDAMTETQKEINKSLKTLIELVKHKF